jgi:hypothetical protein
MFCLIISIESIGIKPIILADGSILSNVGYGMNFAFEGRLNSLLNRPFAKYLLNEIPNSDKNFIRFRIY